MRPRPRLRRSPLTLVLAVVLAGLGGAPAAQAAIGVTGVTVTPQTTQAAAPSSFGLAFGLSDPGQQVKDLTIHLPPGLVGNPLAQPACPVAQFQADACPRATAVGTSQVNADPGNLTIDGTIYNLVAAPGEPARLGIVYRNPTIASLFVQSAVVLRAADGGLDSVIKDLPRQALVAGLVPADTTVKAISLVLDGKFASNPTSCRPAVTRVDVTSYAAPTTVASGEAAFTPTGCDKVPFAPRLAVSIGTPEQGSSPSLTTVITQGPGEAGIRSAAVTLPAGVTANITSPPAGCPRDQAAAGACPASSVIGTAAVRSPLLADELTGNVYFVTGGGTLPGLRIELRGALQINLTAQVSFSKGLLVTTLTGIPDVPVSRFQLAFKGGRTGGVLSNTQALCTGVRRYAATFTSQGDATTTTTGSPELLGCPKSVAKVRRSPTATARVTARGTLVVTTRAGSRRIRGVRLSLARTPGRGGRSSTPGRVRLTGRVATVSHLPARGASRVVVRVGGARALRGTRATVRVRDAGGGTTALRVRVR